MATRAYRRDNRGRFAGANGGTKVTYGKAGGFANAGHRSRVAQKRLSSRNSPRGRAKRALNFIAPNKTAKVGLATAAVGFGIASASANPDRKLTGAGIAFVGSTVYRASGMMGSSKKSSRKGARPRNPAGSRVRR